MENKQKNRISIIIIILVIIGGVGVITVKFLQEKKENWITENEQLYSKAIENIKKKNGYDNIKQDFGIEEQNNKKYAYMWILEETCNLENLNIELD